MIFTEDKIGRVVEVEIQMCSNADVADCVHSVTTSESLPRRQHEGGAWALIESA